METYISLLRGINVSGQRKILMSDLKALYEALKLRDVVTYIQSGNVLFKTDKKESNQSLAKKIGQAIFKKYNFDVTVIVRSTSEIVNIISDNPFLKDSNIDTDKLHVTFLSETPEKEKFKSIAQFDYPPDKFIIIDQNVLLYCPINYGETKLSNKFFETKLNVSATTRSWKTVNKLVELASPSEA
ncbi:MAG: DUF1697 domain-containing protein [Chitinophagales bacterium]|nr:DUF1697 domain-containing protein [Chitinophagales bacterium]